MSSDALTRRRILAGSAAAGTGALAYAADNPLHRTGRTTEATRRTDAAPSTDEFWYAAYAPPVPDADATMMIGVRYLGPSPEAHQFDVVAVAVGRRTTLFETAPLLGTHRLGVRGVAATTTQGADSGGSDLVAGGVVEPPATIVSQTSLSRAALDDAEALADHVGPGSPLGTERDLATAQRLLEKYAADTDVAADLPLTLAGLLYGLKTATTPAADGTPQFEGRGETYRWPLDGVRAHVLRYRSLAVHPGAETLALKVAHTVPRPSLLGSPRFGNSLVVTHPV